MFNKRQAFSLLEIVIVIALLAITAVAILGVVGRVIRLSAATENDLVARGLLQEGVELAEAVRNANVSAASPFYTGLTTGSPVNGVTYSRIIDYNGANTSGVAVTDAAARLKFDATDFYQHTTGTNTKFYRRLFTTYYDDGVRDYLEVKCEVYWTDRGKSYTESLTSLLYDTNYD